ncbi:hypothetical protein BDZ45DRAFT_734311 [Acephala macrosclerotiorum]|nr:hypothetical protein BDZ45DRAFT_734311 [Acephala macrosclerotiorum]
MSLHVYNECSDDLCSFLPPLYSNFDFDFKRTIKPVFIFTSHTPTVKHRSSSQPTTNITNVRHTLRTSRSRPRYLNYNGRRQESKVETKTSRLLPLVGLQPWSNACKQPNPGAGSWRRADVQETKESGVAKRARDGEEEEETAGKGSKKTKVRDRLRFWKSRFTGYFKPDYRSKKRKGTTNQPTRLNPTFYILPDKIDEQAPKQKPGIMKRLKTFCGSIKTQKPKPQASKASECVTRTGEQGHFTHPSGTASNRCVKSCSERTTCTQSHGDPSFSDSNFQRHDQTEIRRSCSSSNFIQNPRRRSETIDSISCQPPSLLDSPRTRRSRLIEQRANDMISASLSTSPEGSGHRNPKANCNHRGWRWCCKCNSKRDKSIQQEGNIAMPQDVADLITYSDESDESLVNVVVDSPVIDDSLVRMKTYDLRVLDSVLMEQSRQLQTDGQNQNSVLQLPGATQLRQSTNILRRTQLQRHSSNVETKDYHRLLAQIENLSTAAERRHTDSEMPHPFESERFLMDDEISELNIPGPAHPMLIGRQLGALAARLGHLSKLNISFSGQIAKSAASKFEQQVGAMEEMNEKLQSAELNENMKAKMLQETEDDMKDALKEAMDTLLDEPSLKQIAAEHNMLDDTSNHSQLEPFTTVRSTLSVLGGVSKAIAINKRVNRQSANTLASSYVDVFHDACSSPTYPAAPPSSPSSEHVPEEYNLAFASPTYPAAAPSSPNFEDIFEDYDIAATSPTYPTAPPPSPYSIEAKSPRSSDPRVWNYPALDSSATSLDFGFHPTLETMPGSWPEQNGFVTVSELDMESEEGAEGQSWRDFDTGLPMGSVDEETSQLARHRRISARESCKPAGPSLGYGRKSQESNSSVDAH